MNLLKPAFIASLSLASVVLMGCDSHYNGHAQGGYVYAQPQPHYVQPEPHYVQQEPRYAQQQPQYVEQQPQYVEPQQPQYVIVQQAPPPVIVETRPTYAAVGSIWIDGYWNWDNHRYNWQAGRYAVPPRHGDVWIAPQYQHDAKGYRYTSGQWKQQNPGKGNGNGNGNENGNGHGNH